MHYIVYTDGGSRGNPGIAGSWVFIVTGTGEVVSRRYKSLGIATNNVAEYTAAQLGIEEAIRLWATEITLRADSQLVIRQLAWEYRVKDPHLKLIYTTIQDTLRHWSGVIRYEHIPREQNKEADRLSNVAMDKA